MKKIHSSGGSGSESSRKGIALVVVLGFLAILTLMAVGMAISMRTERLASNSYLDMVKARMYCQAGLADSMVMLEDILQHPNTPAQHVIAPNYQYYYTAEAGDDSYELGRKQYAVFASIAPTSYPGDPEADIFTNSLIHGTASNFWPYYSQNFQNELGEEGDKMLSEVQWIHVRRTNDQGEVVANGRYMYIGLDVSGALDINYIGREHERPYQIALSKMGSFGNHDDDYIDFISARDDTHIRYETHKDLRDNGGHENSDEPWGLCTFSWCPPMRIVESIDTNSHEVTFSDFNEGWPVYLSSNETEWSQTDIEAAFRLGIRGFETYRNQYGLKKSDLYEMLVDFVDGAGDGAAEYTPENDNFDRPSIEPVPMVNEVMVSSNIANVEVWMPFVGTETNRFTGTFKIEVDADGEEGSLNDAELNDWPSNDRPPLPKTFQVKLSSEVTNSTFDCEIVISSSEGNLDRVDKDTLSDVKLRKHWQCNDPRFNHLPSQWDKNSDTGTMNIINTNNANYADNGGTPGVKGYVADGDYLMYCANRPLKVSGELGYLPVAPWRTIKLYEDPRDNTRDMDQVLDYFTMQENEGFKDKNQINHGQISPNGVFPNARRAAIGVGHTGYKRQGLGLYIEQTSGQRIEADRKDFIGRRGILHDKIGEWNAECRNNTHVIVNLSGVGRSLYSGTDPDHDPVPWFKKKSNIEKYSELRLEDPMRRASQTMNLRQNNILIFLWAQELGTEEIDPNDDDHYDYPVKAEAQAVALIWRDPYPVSNENQYHRKFVRYMRWME